MSDDWRSRAACRNHPHPDLFFPDPSDKPGQREAARICAMCPVTAECADLADSMKARDGVWAGLGRTDTGRAARPPGRPPKQGNNRSCGTAQGFRDHIADGEIPCIACRDAADAAYRAKYSKTFERLKAKAAARKDTA
ncbi:WhiB family transcriptional regulator [Mycolicibacterium vaccae]|uniref:WhiB family transcriptional regulator n=1 Tax=Mycolicibacterium vaccae TaxID=1810 RepID=UPI003D03A15F